MKRSVKECGEYFLKIREKRVKKGIREAIRDTNEFIAEGERVSVGKNARKERYN